MSTANERDKWEYRQVQAVMCRQTWASWSADAAIKEQPTTLASMFSFLAELFRQAEQHRDAMEAGEVSSA